MAPTSAWTRLLRLAAIAALAAACRSPYEVQAAGIAEREARIAFPEAEPTLLEVQLHCGTILVAGGPALDARLKLQVAAGTKAEADRIAGLLDPVAIMVEPGHTLLSVALPQGASLQSVVSVCQLTVPARTSVLIRTREAAVTARGLSGGIEVRGGSGPVEIQMDGGPVKVVTSTGPIEVRGSFHEANLRTVNGRIDLQAPFVVPLSLDVSAGDGDLWLDLGQVGALDVELRGDPSQVLAEPGVRVDWQEVRLDQDSESHVGRFGERGLEAPGRLYLAVDRGTVHLCRSAAMEPGGVPWPAGSR